MTLLEYKCPNCGGVINFDPETQEMLCPYCDSTMDIQSLRQMDAELEKMTEAENIDWGYDGQEWNDGEQDGLAVYLCKSCGGEIVGDETMGATSCPFCSSAVVMTSKFSGTLRPDMLIPFKQSKEQAKAALLEHYKGKRLLPKVFKDENHLEEIKGVYVPFWLFDTKVNAHMEYMGRKIRTWSDSSYNYQETSTYRITRIGDIGFDDVPVDASENIDNVLMESLEPFNYQDAVNFQTAYLAGYFANKYDVSTENAIIRANERITNSTVSAFAGTVIGYSSLNIQSSNIQLSEGAVSYALLPVWLLSTRYENTSYLFAMNGQTGKFVGDLPMDKAAAKAWFWKIFSVSAAVIAVISQLVISMGWL